MNKVNPKGCIMHDSICISFLKWRNYTNGKLISSLFEISCWSLMTGLDVKEVGLAMKGQLEGSLWWWKYSVSWLYWYQHPTSAIVRVSEDVTTGGNCGKVLGIPLYYFLQLQVNMQISENKRFNFKEMGKKFTHILWWLHWLGCFPGTLYVTWALPLSARHGH